MVTVAELMIVIAAYYLIMYTSVNSMVTFLMVSIAIMSTTILVLALRFAQSSTTASQEFIQVSKYTRITIAEAKFFKSLYALEWKIGYGGNGFIVTKETVPTIFKDIIISNIINLIITSKRYKIRL
jgi:hypothetical protein